MNIGRKRGGKREKEHRNATASTFPTTSSRGEADCNSQGDLREKGGRERKKEMSLPCCDSSFAEQSDLFHCLLAVAIRLEPRRVMNLQASGTGGGKERGKEGRKADPSGKP